MPHNGRSWRSRFALIADAAFLLLAGLAVFINRTGGVKWRLGVLRVSASSGARVAAVAIVVLFVRHAIVRHPSIAARLMTALQRVHRLARIPGERLAAAAGIAAAILGGLALIVDLAGGVDWRVGALRIAGPTGASVAIAALVMLLARRVLSHPRGGFKTHRVRLPAPRSTKGKPDTTRGVETRNPFAWPSRHEWLFATLVIGASAVVLLREQLLAFTNVPDLGDPLYSIWRLGWIAHQLPLDPAHLLDANIFHPAVRTLAYSDTMLLPTLIGVPAVWLGAPLAVVYTSVILVAFLAAGLAMFALARAITGQAGAAAIAGLVFAFDPFRFAHYSHLELLFTCWMPLAMLCLLRVLTTGRRRDGVLLGIFVALQGLSGIYCAAYFSVSLTVFAVCWICFVARPPLRAVGSVGLAVLIALAAAGLVTIPYWSNRATVGERRADEIRAYSAFARDYLTASRRSAVYGTRLYERENAERELFPGTLPIILGAASFLPPMGPAVLPAAITLAASVDASLGLHGTVYTWLDTLPPFRGFRVPARFRAVAGLYLALLAGLGVAGVMRRISSPWPRSATLLAIGIAMLVDLHPTLGLQPLWNHAPVIYSRVPDRRAVLADLPLPGDSDLFWHDPVYMYFSTFHWHPLINGSSGFVPAWYSPLGAISREFPSNQTLDAFRALGTEYFVLHEGYYHDTFKRVVADAEAQPRLQFVATSSWEEGECRLYRLLR